ncbi:MAG: AcvB/VirJ family lysyl-phosphatidylglycerol hydrolase [Hyphomonadaceae bacterium]
MSLAKTSMAFILLGATALTPLVGATHPPLPQTPAVSAAPTNSSKTAGPEVAFKMLPLHPPEHGPDRAKTVAIFLTGDGGWASFDQKVCAALTSAGVPATGFDTGAYFSEMRDPTIASQALAGAIETVKDRWSADHVIIVGYSFGADVAPFLVNRLPPDLKSSIDRVALMSPSAEAPFQVTLTERVGLDAPGARPVIPELKTLNDAGARIACLYGERDHDAVCPSLTLASMKKVEMRGGHGLADDHQAVANAILQAWPVER